MIPLLLATAGRAVAGTAGRAMAAKGVVSALKNRGYISKAGKVASQMARAGSVPRGNSSSFRNPYTFANKPTEQAAVASDMGSSVQDKTQTERNTKKQTLIISADNVFLRTSKAIMDSVMPAAPENIERASATDEPTPEKLKDLLSPKSKTESIMLFGVLIGKVLGTIVKKLKEFLDPIFKVLAKGLAVVYRGLAKVTFGGVSDAYTSAAENLEAYSEGPKATNEEPAAKTPGVSPAPAETASVATGYTPAVTPTSPTSPKSEYASPSGFFGAPMLGTSTTTAPSAPVMVTKNDNVQSLFKTTDTSKNTNSNIVNLIKNEEGFEHKAYFDPRKDRQDAQNNELEKKGMTPKPYTFSIGFGHQITKEEVAKGYIDLGDEKIPVKGEGGKDTVLGSTKKVAEPKALKLLQIDLPKYMSRAKQPLGEEAWSRLTEKQQAALISYSYNVGSTKGLVEKQGLKEAIMRGDTTTAGNIIAEKGIKTSSGKIDPNLVKRRKREGELFKQDSIKAAPSGSLNIKPISSSGLLSAPTQATGRNIEMTSQILNAAPVASTAQNAQPVVINNINAPTVASGKGSSGPAIELSVFRNIDNSIMANTNRHLRAGILGV
jgi:GH24 family phage-related lysozyme (muramidase)